MAKFSFEKLNIFVFTSVVILALVIILSGAIGAIIFYAGDLPFTSVLADRYIRSVLFFTIFQAGMSTLSTIVFAIPIARALHRRPQFFGRNLLIKIINISFILPAIIIVIGIAVVHGKNGWINNLLSFYGGSLEYYLYGFFGILVGHIAFSLPLAVRIFLNKLESVPENNWRLAAQLDFKSKEVLTIIELPILAPSIASASILIFMMCFTSFVIVLGLGGGPNYTTIEVAIYQALRFDFDINRAVVLSLIQFSICFILMINISKYIYHSLFVHNLDVKHVRPDSDHLSGKLTDGFFIFCLFVLVGLPILAVVLSGFNNRFVDVVYSKEFWEAFGNSLFIAIFSGILSLFFAAGLLLGSFYFKYSLQKNNFASRLMLIANFSIVIPPFIFITGLFILLRPVIDLFDVVVYLIILVNAIMSLPFVVGVLYQAVTSFTKEEMWLCESLNISGWNFFKLICWGRIKASVAYTLALSVAISWGDLSVITLFGNNDFITLPYLLYHNMSNYRVSDAEVIAFILLIVSYILFCIIEKFVAGEDRVRA